MTLAKACRELMIREPFYGLFLLNLNKKYVTDDIVEIAAVGLEGINPCLYINKDRWDDFSDEEQLAILKHELLHICFEHLLTLRRFPDQNIANIAADLEINQYINNPPSWMLNIHDPAFKAYNFPSKAGTRVYYDMIQAEPEKLPEELKMPNSHNWGDFEGLSDAEESLIKNQVEHFLKESAQQIGKQRGTIPSELSEKIGELFKVKEPIFNWKAYFRRILGNSYKIFTKKSYRKLSKRFEGSAGVKVKKKHRVLVAIDTSGSVSGEELLEFFNEIHHIYKAGTDITILECDAKIQREYRYKGSFDGKVHGRGGTNFTPVVEYYNKHREKFTVLIFFTDGYAPVDHLKTKKSMIWMITSTGDHSQKYPGHTIKIPKKKN